MKYITLAIAISFQLNNAIAQDCAVSVDALKGKYDGECKNGKAEGKGKATGTDTYDGEFKAGLPHGKGKYVWNNGSSFDGEWNKGNKQGYGVMTYKLAAKDSIIDGYWKKDIYAGKYEKPYLIHRKTRDISEVRCRKTDAGINRLEFFLESETGGLATSFGGGINSKPTLTDIAVLTGNYERRNTNPDIGKKTSYTFEDVTFPFRAIFTIGNEQVEVEFFEAGRWVMDVKVHN